MVHEYVDNYFKGSQEVNVFVCIGKSSEHPEENKPTIIDKLPVGEGSSYFETDTYDIWFFDGEHWLNGTDEPTPYIKELQNPISTITGDEDITFELEFSGDYETKTIGERNYQVPIYSAVNVEPIYESEATDKDITFAYVSGADNMSAYKDDDTIEGNTFNADLTQRIELYVEQNDKYRTYGALVYIDAEITPDPVKPEIVAGSLRADTDPATISDFNIYDSDINIDNMELTGANWYLNGIEYDVSENVKLYLGTENDGVYEYVAHTPQSVITQENNKYRLMPILNGFEPIEANWNTYDIVFDETTTAKKKKKIKLFGRKKTKKGGKK